MTDRIEYFSRPEGERLSVLETEVTNLKNKLNDVGQDVKLLLAANSSVIGAKSLVFLIMSLLGGAASIWQVFAAAFHTK